jgi:hypothetical protein
MCLRRSLVAPAPSAAGDFDGQIPGSPGKLVHLKSALFLRCEFGFDNLILPGERAFLLQSA